MNTTKTITLTAALLSTLTVSADRIFHMPMDVSGTQVAETVSGKRYDVNTANVVEGVAGARGGALRLDGYSNYVAVGASLGTLPRFTFTVWTAMETWPIIEHDVQNETEATCIAGNYDAAAKSGFGFFVTRNGRLSFRFYTQGWPGEVTASEPLPLYRWNNLVAVGDGSKVTLYNNGVALGTANCKGVSADGTFMIGKARDGRKLGPFCLNTINGIIDEVELYDEALSATTIQGWRADADPDLGAVATDRYADDLWRPAFHGMPSRNWTNETHGLVYYNDQYHLFFQKNANGPYMSRLQWGHLVSDNLYQWHEAPIAIGSDRWYDLKGCWSGCIAVDDVVTGGKPNIIYTGVDYARAMIAQASPADDDLLSWVKPANPIINGRPNGLSDDFRDPYFFRNGDDAYIIVGSSKDGKGVCTLHKYNPVARTWSNDGATFFQASNAMFYGSFWEMPTLTHLNDRSLFTATPLGISDGVKVLYWTGSVSGDGTFSTSANAATVEFKGFAKEGYGMLSPSIMQHGGVTVAMGIVPDKLPTDRNYQMGWAHTYSLPRQWSVNDAGQLVQKPYVGLEAMRSALTDNIAGATINGSVDLADMHDRQIEVIGRFTVGSSPFGFTFYKSGDKGAKLTYNPTTGKLTLDLRSLDRVANDAGVFDGLYQTNFPSPIAQGSVMKLHVFVDHSVMDIFVNDMWASSVRLFPTDAAAIGVDVFSEGGGTVADVSSWRLDVASSGVTDVIPDNVTGTTDIYSACGVCVMRSSTIDNARDALRPGVYIAAGRKFVVR